MWRHAPVLPIHNNLVISLGQNLLASLLPLHNALLQPTMRLGMRRLLRILRLDVSAPTLILRIVWKVRCKRVDLAENRIFARRFWRLGHFSS